MDKDKTYCADCNNELKANQKPCPYCGSSKRKYDLTSTAVLGLSASARLTNKDPNGFVKYDIKSRNKISKASKKPAHEELEIDRTDKKVTVKRHQVWETNEKGEQEIVHDEKKVSKAKRRNAL